jgi:hypothetical protein
MMADTESQMADRGMTDSSVRVAVKMQPAADADPAGRAQFKATLPMGVLFEKSLDRAQLEQERAALEENYRALVATLTQIRSTLKVGNTLRYWFFGDAIIQFEQQHAHGAMFVDKLSDHLARDVHFSRTMIDLCRRFRLKFPDPARIDPRISFRAYHRSGFDPARHVKKLRSRAGTRAP